MISEKMQDAINEQINAELFSSYLYLAMSAYFEDANLDGFAGWMRLQSQEEYGHGMKLVSYLVERGGRVELKAIDKPQKEWESPLAAYQAAYDHECLITRKIGDLVELSQAEKDHATEAMLQWFVSEQVEEEASADYFVQKLKLAKDSPGGLFMLDRAAAARAAG